MSARPNRPPSKRTRTIGVCSTIRPDARRDRHEGEQAQREGQVVLEGPAVLRERLPGEERKDRRRERDGEPAEDELLQAVRVIEVRDVRVAEARGETRRDDGIDGVDAVGEEPRRHQQEHRPHGRIPPAEMPGGLPPATSELRDLDGDLEEPSEEHARGQAVRRLGEARGDDDRAQDHRDVQEDRRRRRDRETVPWRSGRPDRSAASETRKMYGKIQRLRTHRQLELPRVRPELPGEQVHEQRRAEDSRRP